MDPTPLSVFSLHFAFLNPHALNSAVHNWGNKETAQINRFSKIFTLFGRSLISPEKRREKVSLSQRY